MSEEENFAPEVGQLVEFTGFTSKGDDLPDNNEALEEGEQYKIVVVQEETDENEESYALEAPNPDFDDSKRVSKKSNPKTVTVVVFIDEIGLAEEDEGEGEDEDEDEAEDEAEDEVEEEKPAPKKRAATKKKAPAKKAPAKKATAKKTTAKKTTAKKGKATKKAAPKEEEDEDLKGMVILEKGEEDEEIVALIEDADDICVLAAELADETIQAEYRLGGILYHTRIEKAFRQFEKGKYDVKGGWQQYVEAELNVGYRKAMYLIDVYANWNKFGLDPEKVAEIGWAKAKDIVGVMTDENAEELIGLAEDNTARDLKDTIKESYSTKDGKKEVVKKVTFKFRLVEDEGKTIADLMEQAQKTLKLKKADEVFAHIIGEWAAEHLDVSKTRKTARRGGTRSNK